MTEVITPPSGRHNQPSNVHTIESLALAREGFFIEGNTLIKNDILHASLEGFNPDPVLKPDSGLSAVSLESTRITNDRIHRLYSIDLEGFKHAVEITDPSKDDPEYVVLSFPGFTECIEGDFRKRMHASLATLHPAARIISIGTNGVGPIGDKYEWSKRKLHSIDEMGSQRLIITKALSNNLPVIGMATSMGTKILHRMAEQNLFSASEDDRINLIGLCLLSPALIDPENILKDMAIRFVPGMIIDIAKELGYKSSPKEVFETCRSAAGYALGKNDGTALLNQLLGLLAGTSEVRISSVAAEIPMAIIAGECDSLAQRKMWERIKDRHAHNLLMKIILGRGHSLAMKPEKAASQSHQISRLMIQQAVDLRALKMAA